MLPSSALLTADPLPFQTSQAGGQRYSDTSPFSIPCRFQSLKSFVGESQIRRLLNLPFELADSLTMEQRIFM
jgi:hypothetical protein